WAPCFIPQNRSIFFYNAANAQTKRKVRRLTFMGISRAQLGIAKNSAQVRIVFATVLSVPSRLLHIQICKSSQVFRIDVGDGPEFESITIPMRNIIAILSETFRGCVATRFRRPNKQVNKMFIALVDERRHLPTIDI